MLRSARAARRVCLCMAAVIAACLPTIDLLHAQASATRVPEVIPLHGVGAGDRARIQAAARESLSLYEEWLGPLTNAEVVVVDPPWWPAPETMDLESQVAFGLARLWFPATEGQDAADFFNGAAWYLQSHAVSRLFDLTFRRTAHSAEAVRVFDGHVPLTFPALRFDAPAAGLARGMLPGAAGTLAGGPRLPRVITPRAIRVAHAFASLERLVGLPRSTGALRALADAGASTGTQAIAVLSAGLGPDVSWLFDAALNDAVAIRYAIESLESQACEIDNCHRARVTVARLGEGVFSGRSQLRIGSYESGDALEVRVDFADGQSVSAYWDGRDRRRTFEFEGPANPRRARLDPDAVMLLDDNLLDHAKVSGGSTNAPVEKWAARWLVWLQHAMLAYSALV